MKLSKAVALLFFLALPACAKFYPSLGIDITIPDKVVEIPIDNAALLKEVKASVALSEKMRAYVDTLPLYELKEKIVIVWLNETTNGDITILKAIRTNKRLNLQNNYADIFCSDIDNKLSNTFGFGLEYCKLTRSIYPLLHFKHKALAFPNTHFTENYTADIKGQYTITFQMTSSKESFHEASASFQKMIKSVK